MGGLFTCVFIYLSIYLSISLSVCLSALRVVVDRHSRARRCASRAWAAQLGRERKREETKRNETKANWPLFIKAHSFPPSPRAEDYDERAARCPPRRVVVDHPAVHEMEHSGRLPRDGDDAHAAARERDVRERVE